MKRTLAGAAIAALAFGLTACGSDQPTAVETVTVSASPTTTTETVAVRQPGNAAQIDLYVRAINNMYAENGQPAATEKQALDLADSMCNFLDAGNSPYDAAQLLEDEGFPKAYTSEMVSKGIGAACTEHLS